jgi:hypothetical protein
MLIRSHPDLSPGFIISIVFILVGETSIPLLSSAIILSFYTIQRVTYYKCIGEKRKALT